MYKGISGERGLNPKLPLNTAMTIMVLLVDDIPLQPGLNLGLGYLGYSLGIP